MKLSVKQIVEICEGTLICGNLDLEIKTFSKDTRTIKSGDCYIGIQGETFDGNMYFKEAFQNGAIACILDQIPNHFSKDCNHTVICVKNSIEALQALAKYVRSTLHIPVIAITGSAGKTSTKDMIASILSQKYKVLKTPQNLNGQIGLPLSILSVTDEEVMVLEMGMNHLGHISKLTDIARPTIAVITNIGTSHIGMLGSRENILKAKLEILEGMEEGSPLIINQDNDLLAKLKLSNYEVYTCGIHSNSHYRAYDIQIKNNKSYFNVKYKDKEFTIHLSLIGDVFVQNSLLAIAVADLLDLSHEEIKKGLENVSLSDNRMELLTLKQNIIVINDTYNSSYEAVCSALETLKSYKGKRKIAILGDILELGNFSEEIHRKIGRLSILKELNYLLLSGENSKWIYDEAIHSGVNPSSIYYLNELEEFDAFLSQFIEPEDVILVKASHGMNFKHIVSFLVNKK